MKITSNITIVIADDHPIMLKGLKDELMSEGYKVIGLANNGAKALDEIVSKRPNIAILDIEMPLLSGFEVIEKCQPETSQTKFIFMSYHKEKAYIVQAKKHGAKGYLLKEDGLDEIINCINNVLQDKFYYSKSLNVNIDTLVNQEIKKLKLLTPSERSILKLISQNLSSNDISENLGISKRTVDKHRSNIIKKLGLENEVNALQSWIARHTEWVKTL
jgi:DNA-binding NarL/FixJ family response regulator